MATDPNEIELTVQQKQKLAERADQSGRGWRQLLAELLGDCNKTGGNGATQQSFHIKVADAQRQAIFAYVDQFMLSPKTPSGDDTVGRRHDEILYGKK